MRTISTLSCVSAGLFVLQALVGCSSESGSGDEEALTESEQTAMTKDAAAAGRDAAGSAPKDAGGSPSPTGKLDAGGGKPASQPDAGSSAPIMVDAGAATDAGGKAPDAASGSELDRFSFFMTSLKAMRELSKSQDGFGGDLRFGETGEGAGLRGADKICTAIAERSMPGSGAKEWHAFLSATQGAAGGGPVHAIDRIGNGPWYDRNGRLVASNKADIAQVRPASADPEIKNDLPNEDGVPNHNPDGTGEVDNHHVLTGSNDQGQLYANSAAATCSDWTKSARDTADAPRVGLSWPRGGRGGGGGGGFGGAGSQHWLSAMDESGCAPGVGIVEMGGPNASNPTVGSGGGYGAIYCFALTP